MGSGRLLWSSTGVSAWVTGVSSSVLFDGSNKVSIAAETFIKETAAVSSVISPCLAIFLGIGRGSALGRSDGGDIVVEIIAHSMLSSEFKPRTLFKSSSVCNVSSKADCMGSAERPHLGN